MVTAPIVVKLGGRALEAPGAHAELAAELSALPTPVVVVHGGGRDVSDWCTRLGIESHFANGLRVTDAPTLEVVVAVLAGLANKRLVARLREAGVDAVGVSLADGGIATVAPHPDHATLGAVAEIRRVHPALLETLLANGRTPVVSSVAACAGGLLNVNADDAAAAIAAALGAGALIMLSDVDGLSIGGRLVDTIAADAIAEAVAGGEVTGGMIPKLAAARAAVDGGAARAWIAAWHGPGSLRALLGGGGRGTSVTAAHVEEARHA